MILLISHHTPKSLVSAGTDCSGLCAEPIVVLRNMSFEYICEQTKPCGDANAKCQVVEMFSVRMTVKKCVCL